MEARTCVSSGLSAIDRSKRVPENALNFSQVTVPSWEYRWIE
jgi:hypothetical protein